MKSGSYIVLGRRRLDVESVELGISIQTEDWVDERKKWLYGPKYVGANYWLSVTVNEESGEDGAPAPEAQAIPVTRVVKGQHPFLSELDGLVVDDAGDWDAWYGNDAPELEENELTFGKWNPARRTIAIEWRAKYTEGQKVKPFRFSGSALFTGIDIRVKAAEDADAFLSQALGSDYLKRLRKKVGAWDDLGKSFPKDRRRWLSVSYMPKPTWS